MGNVVNAGKDKGYSKDDVIDKDDFVLPMLPPGGSVDEIITEINE